MAKWWKLGFGKKDKEQGPPPETPPTPAAPAPAPPPQEPPQEAAEEAPKKRGFLGRLADKVTGKARKEKAAKAEGEAEAPPEAPPEAPAAKPSAPPAGGGGEGEEAGEGGGAGPEAPEKERYFPSSISVSADGDWSISANTWYGTMSGTLTGHSSVKEFILAYEKGNWTRCCELIAGVWPSDAADLVDVYASEIHSVTWS
ncbi:hypothetical protein [Streptomyces sp. NPDC048659]|uniref:hypothetical protein n=1 Tax=Streptomyces sp. NPDC048659 TaxID=3155489 RepID=UPI003422E257